MYGLVNQAVEDLAVQLGDAPLWSAIKERAGVDLQAFVAMQSYDDDVTYRLVAATSAVLEMPPKAVLEAFGEHWITYAGQSNYGPIFATMGATLPEFLRNLDSMHVRITLSMPQLKPPSFSCEEVDAETVLVRYWSHRDGLAPMVTGLLRGLGALFDLAIKVNARDREPGADHDTFVVTYRPKEPLTATAANASENG